MASSSPTISEDHHLHTRRNSLCSLSSSSSSSSVAFGASTLRFGPPHQRIHKGHPLGYSGVSVVPLKDRLDQLLLTCSRFPTRSTTTDEDPSDFDTLETDELVRSLIRTLTAMSSTMYPSDMGRDSEMPKRRESVISIDVNSSKTQRRHSHHHQQQQENWQSNQRNGGDSSWADNEMSPASLSREIHHHVQQRKKSKGKGKTSETASQKRLDSNPLVAIRGSCSRTVSSTPGPGLSVGGRGVEKARKDINRGNMVKLNFVGLIEDDSVAVSINVVNTWEKLMAFIRFNGITVDPETQILNITDPKGCIINAECWPPGKFRPSQEIEFSTTDINVRVSPKVPPNCVIPPKNLSPLAPAHDVYNIWCCYSIYSPHDLPLAVTITAKDDYLTFSNIVYTNKHEGIVLTDRRHGVDWAIDTDDGWNLISKEPDEVAIETPGTGEPLRVYHEVQFCMSWRMSAMAKPLATLRIDVGSLMIVVRKILVSLGFPHHKVIDFNNYWIPRLLAIRPIPEYIKLDIMSPKSMSCPLVIKTKVDDHEKDLEPGVWYQRQGTQLLLTFTPVNCGPSSNELVDISAQDIVNIKKDTEDIEYLGHGRGRVKNLDGAENTVSLFGLFGVLLPSQHDNRSTSGATDGDIEFDSPNVADWSNLSAPSTSPNGDGSRSDREKTGWACCNPNKKECHYDGYLNEEENKCWSCSHMVCADCTMGTKAVGKGVYRKLGAEKVDQQKTNAVFVDVTEEGSE